MEERDFVDGQGNEDDVEKSFLGGTVLRWEDFRFHQSEEVTSTREGKFRKVGGSNYKEFRLVFKEKVEKW